MFWFSTVLHIYEYHPHQLHLIDPPSPFQNQPTALHTSANSRESDLPKYVAAISNDNLYRALKTIANCKTEKASHLYRQRNVSSLRCAEVASHDHLILTFI